MCLLLHALKPVKKIIDELSGESWQRGVTALSGILKDLKSQT